MKPPDSTDQSKGPARAGAPPGRLTALLGGPDGATGASSASAVLRALERSARPPTGRTPLQVRAEFEGDWWVSSTSSVLHHAPATDGQLRALVESGLIEAPAGRPYPLTCGGTALLVARPGPLEARDVGRCSGCCTALGYPPGVGSPRWDEACAPVLAERTAGLG